MLYELIYRSKAVPSISDPDIESIMTSAKAFNSKNNVTGCLLFSNNQFLQMLEGDSELVIELFEKIKTDKRHSDVVLLHMKEIRQRTFPNWTMAFKSLETSVLQEDMGISNFHELNSETDSHLSRRLFFKIGEDL